jgi:hypothetical protein
VGDGGSYLTNVQWKPIQNCHNESPLYTEYILIRMKKSVVCVEKFLIQQSYAFLIKVLTVPDNIFLIIA